MMTEVCAKWRQERLKSRDLSSRSVLALRTIHVTSALCCVLQCRKATERCEKHERSRTERGSHSPRQCGLLMDGRALDVYHTGKASWWVRSDMWSWQWKACTRPSVPRSAPVAVDTDDRVIMSSIELQAVLYCISWCPGCLVLRLLLRAAAAAAAHSCFGRQTDS
jgi:hypothetical protein